MVGQVAHYKPPPAATSVSRCRPVSRRRPLLPVSRRRHLLPVSRTEKENFCSKPTKNRNSSILARLSPRHARFPEVHKHMKMCRISSQILCSMVPLPRPKFQPSMSPTLNIGVVYEENQSPEQSGGGCFRSSQEQIQRAQGQI
ncbi:hypothetical protein EYF80_055772 [Liparis tanakae]|uniref:Uncharacterized protein n=1 Tax=Liparis tanakae TaxID=230148 RepID=A0A4Z2EYV0_9TELE|nr:hypothetical protein EYF80_055772 [Liparis tanakae]